MKPYLVSLGAGLLVGVVYSLLGVRSPAPPIIALIGLAGILLGEQITPIVRRLAERVELSRFNRSGWPSPVESKRPPTGERDA